MCFSGSADRQYTQRKLQRSVTETRRSVIARPNLSVSGILYLDAAENKIAQSEFGIGRGCQRRSALQNRARWMFSFPNPGGAGVSA
jgi:hypothetical protein